MDVPSTWPPDDQGFTLSLIRRRAKKLLHRAGMPPTELEEIEQHLVVEVWELSKAFDPNRGSWPAFAQTLVDTTALKLARHWRAQKRAPHRCKSLNAKVVAPSGETTELADALTESDGYRHIGKDQPTHVMSADLSMDLAQVTSTFSPDWQQTLSLLATHSKLEVVQATGTKRTTLNSRLKQTRCELLQQDYFEDFRE